MGTGWVGLFVCVGALGFFSMLFIINLSVKRHY